MADTIGIANPSASDSVLSGILPVGLPSAVQANNNLAAIAQKYAATQQAQTAAYSAQAKTALANETDLANKNNAARGAADAAGQRDAQDVADGTASIISQLHADPTDPNSTMAASNAAIEHLNRRILGQYQAIDQVQSDGSVGGILREALIAPGLQHGMQQLTATRDNFINMNDELLKQVALQKGQVSDTVTAMDVAGTNARATFASTAAALKVQQEQLSTLGQIQTITDQGNMVAMNATSVAARARQEAIMLPLEAAIKSGQAYEMTNNIIEEAHLASAVGMNPVAIRQNKAMWQSNPQVWNAMVFFSNSGGNLSFPTDAGILKSVVNPAGMLNADGTPKPSLKFLQETDQIQPVIDKTMEGYRTWLATRYLGDLAKQDAVFKSGAMNREDYNHFLADNAMAGVQVMANANINPAIVLSKIAQVDPSVIGQIPKVVEQIQNHKDNGTKWELRDMYDTILDGSHDADINDVAKQLTIYSQHYLATERSRQIYSQVGVPAPSALRLDGEQMGFMNQVTSFATSAFGGQPSTSKTSYDPTNPADMLAYARARMGLQKYKAYVAAQSALLSQAANSGQIAGGM